MKKIKGEYMKHLISLKELSKEDLLEILKISQILKVKRSYGEVTNYLQNKTMVMFFEKSSTRTRLSFEAALTELGGHSIFLDKRTTQFGLAEFQDEIRAVMAYCDILMYRAKKVADVNLAASFNQVPVIDACSEKYHPAQALTDMLTMIEHSNGLDNIKKVCWLGMENNVSNTLMLVCVKLGIQFTVIAPEIDQDSVDPELNAMAEATGLVSRTQDFESGLKDANFIHTDTWMNMEFFDSNGQVLPEKETNYHQMKEKFMPYQINSTLMQKYCPNAKIMDCMPLHVGYEISRDAIDHPNSIIFQQAENRLHAQKGIIMWMLGVNA
jgi:ornithine carbamoyltransferase